MVTPADDDDRLRIAAMGVMHRAYCRDKFCFDGDRIDNPEIDAALDAYRDEQREVGAVAALKRVETKAQEGEWYDVEWYDVALWYELAAHTATLKSLRRSG